MARKLALAALAALALAAAPIAQDNLDDLASRLQLATGEATTLAQEAAAARETLLAARAQAQAAAAALEGAEAAYIEKVAEAGAARLIAAQIAGEYAAAVKAAGNTAPPDPPTAGFEPPPDISGLPFSGELPPFPEYKIPTREDCDWIFEDGWFRSQRGLQDYQRAGTDSPQIAYHRSHMAGHEKPIRFGVYGDMGACRMDYWQSTLATGEASPLSIEIVGLDDTAEVRGATWRVAGDGPNVVPEHVAFYNIGLRAIPDSFIIRANGGVGMLIMDGCWWLRRKGTPVGTKTADSGMHIDKWDTLVWRRHQWRGERPDEPGITLGEHVAYLESATGAGSTWIIENNLFGALRTGFQIRPGQSGTSDVPRGPVVIAHNYADGLSYDGHAAGYGWNNSWHHGGSCLSVWSNPHSPTYIFRNRIQDARYGCLMVGGQGPGIGWNNENGYPIKDVWVFENTFENSTRFQPNPSGGPDQRTTMRRTTTGPTRVAVSLTSMEHLRIGPNVFQHGAGLTLHNDWAHGHGVPRYGRVEISESIAGMMIGDIDDNGNNYQLTAETKQGMVSTFGASTPIATPQ